MNTLGKTTIHVSMLTLFVLGTVGLAHADTTYDFTLDHCTGSCGPANTIFGTVVLHQVISGEVQVTVSLNSPYELVETGFPGTFGFNLNGIPSINISGLPAGFGTSTANPQTVGAYHFDGLGLFNYIVTDTKGNGAAHNDGSSFSFDVSASGLTVGSFAQLSTIPPGSEGADFVVDIYNSSTSGTFAGKTGPVGALLAPTVVPEPGTLALFGTGLIGLTGLRRRKLLGF